MKHLLLLTTLLLAWGPIHLPAAEPYRHPSAQVGYTGLRANRQARPVKVVTKPYCTPRHGHRRHKPGKPWRGRPVTWWPVAAPAAPEPAPVVIVYRPPSEPAPAPEPPKEWVPAVMATRIEPGYWDHPIKKIWMGDHWRFVQDLAKRRWVPEAVVEYVKQAGHWKTVD